MLRRMQVTRVAPLAKLLRSAREAAGLSQGDVAEQLGVSQGAVSMWETGQSRPALSRIRRIAEVLGVDDVELTRAAEVRFVEKEAR
jgi:transcriptional regulator with XRE-family HTH domain